MPIDPGAARDMISRLARVEGHVRAIGRLTDERACAVIVQQPPAARNALERAATLLMVTAWLNAFAPRARTPLPQSSSG